jgi:hypothetical protein
MTEGIDAGPILVQGAVDVDERSALVEVERRKATAAAAALPRALDLIAAGDPGDPQVGAGSYFSERDYRARIDLAEAFLEGRTLEPLARVIAAMAQAAREESFERAAYWRDRFERLEWLLAATSRARAAVDLLTFVYRDPGDFGDDRAYLVRHGLVLAQYPWPATPIEREAFRGVVTDQLAQPTPPPWPLPLERIDEILMLMAWFRRHPDSLRRTSAFKDWL